MLIIKGGRVIDPKSGTDRVMNIFIEKGKIFKLAAARSQVPEQFENADVIDASGKLVAPGLVDMHVHLREPGHEHKETIASGCNAAAAGGFTTVVCMPNTEPVNDHPSVTDLMISKAAEHGGARVHPVGAITIGLKGEALSEMGGLKEAGAVAFSDDGRPVMNSGIMRHAMEYARGLDMPIISHCEDLNLKAKGVMNESSNSTRFGLRPIPVQVEEIMVARDISLCELTGARLHIAHVSAEASLRHIRAAKKRGLPVTAETAPHYLFLTDEAVGTYDTSTKVNPPLRSNSDLASLRKAIADGTIDAIATDHAPHSPVEKEVEYEVAAPGISGLETSLALILRLVDEGIISILRAIELMSLNPCRILGISGGTLDEGADADITIIDQDNKWIVDPSKFKSKGRNTPFSGHEMKGVAAVTLVRGRIIHRAGT